MTRRIARAVLALSIAVALLLGAALVLGSKLLPPTDRIEFLAVGLVSAIALSAGIAVAIRDVWVLRRESAALSLLNVPIKLDIPADGRPTLARERIRRVQGAAESSAIPPERLRVLLRSEAAARMSAIGGTTRFLASALLLLAVIGTFLGMKQALPGLSAAVTESRAVELSAGGRSQANSVKGEELNRSSIARALDDVANAFGSNFLAVLGALALATASFGASADRRRFLNDLEQASERERGIYSLLPASTDGAAIERIVHQLQSSLGEVAAVAEGVGELRGAINNFQDTLARAIEGLQSSFTDRFQRSLIESHGRISSELLSLTTGVGEVSSSLAKTAVAYEGLVSAVEQRDLRAEAAQGAVVAASERLAESSAANVDALERAAKQLDSAADAISKLREDISALTAAHREQVTSSQRTIGSLVASAESAVKSHGDLANVLEGHTRALDASAVRLTESSATMASHVIDSTAKVSEILVNTQSASREELGRLTTSIESASSAFSRIPDQAGAAMSAALTEAAREFREETRTDRARLAELSTSIDALRREVATLNGRLSSGSANGSGGDSDTRPSRDSGWLRRWSR